MLRMSLRGKILLLSSTVLVALILAMLLFVDAQARRYADERLAAELEQDRQRMEIMENERLAGLRLTAQLVASFPTLNALLSTHDAATIQDFLVSYQEENKRSDLLIALDPAGRVLGRTDPSTPGAVPEFQLRWARPALARRSAAGFLATNRGVYHAVCVPAAAGNTVFGFVIAGGNVDDGYASTLRGESGDEVVLVGESVLGSTLPASSFPWRSRTEWESALGGAQGRATLKIAGFPYATLAIPFGSKNAPGLLAVTLRSRDLALAPYRRIQLGLLALGMLAAVIGITASAVFSRTVTASIGRLVEGTRQVAEGNYDCTLDIHSGDEIDNLGQAFNSMVRGLRERAEMQKFVSQSTVEMVQAGSRREAAAGERQVLTIFFSDVRGFTLMSENRDPAEVVKILNSCLSLQAEKVKKFQGDIDKYMGDCVMALFSGEDSALNAIRCGIEILKALDAHQASHPGEIAIQIGIGIVTGEVILGSIGSEDRRDFTAVGSNVNLCSRLCALAAAKEILVAESSYQLVQDLVAAQRLDPVKLKGFSEPVPVYRIGPRS
jgi:class 3 adenylate cyclase